MVIDRIGNVNKVTGTDSVQNQKTRDVKKSGGEDVVSISPEAQEAKVISRATETVKATADVRMERVQEVRAKLDRGDYDKPDNEILDKVAEKIAQTLLRI